MKLDAETAYYNSIYELPDRRKIEISNEKFLAPEILFQPHLDASEKDGIDVMTFNSINVNNNIIILGM